MFKKIIIIILGCLFFILNNAVYAENKLTLDHMVMTVQDIHKTIHFYHDILGLKINSYGVDNKRKAILIGDQKISLRQNDVNEKSLHSPSGSYEFFLETKLPLEKLIAEFKHDQINLEKKPTHRMSANGLITSFYIRDPDQNLIEIASYHEVTTKHTAVLSHSINPNELVDFDKYPVKVKHLISDSLELAKHNLSYKFGSINPENGGLDCSGTIYYLLHERNNHAIPRDAEHLYMWLLKNHHIHNVDTNNLQSNEFSSLRPGDLLFWSGTYRTYKHITHVMIYLGKDKNGNPLIFGSSSGRMFRNVKVRGVSVYDFTLPKRSDRAKFVAYGRIPW